MESKPCKLCGRREPSVRFRLARSAAGVAYRDTTCNPCRYEIRKLKERGLPSPRARDTRPRLDSLTNTWVKVCSACRAEQPVENFSTYRGKPQSHCKSCRAAYVARYKQTERAKALQAKYYAGQRARSSADERREYLRSHRKKNSDYYRSRDMTRRARKKATTVVAFSRADIIKRDGLVCYLCGKVPGPGEVTLDHVVPLARGGSHTPDNVRVACFPCNRRKFTFTPEELAARRAA